MKPEDIGWTEAHQQNSEPDFYGKWISVEDKLPEPGTWVLGYTGNLVQMLFLDGVSPVIWLGYEGDWDLFVSHWMLLPEKPPQKKGDV